MKGFVEKLIERLEEKKNGANSTFMKFRMNVDLGRVFGLENSIEIVNQLAEEYVPETNVGKWIPCSERLPEDGDNRFYMCIVENHEEDVPMFCQYCEEHGFGFWQDLYDEHTLGFLDSEFKTNEELGYEKVIAWQPLPEPYKPEQQKEIPTNYYTERFNRVV